MVFSTHRVIVPLAICHAAFAQMKLETRDGPCNENFKECSPKGASSANAPEIGEPLSTLYVELLDSINEVQNVKRDFEIKARADAGSLCCAEGTQCLLLNEFDIPLCYDKFTTNYLLPGGASGQVVSGDYSSSDGTANLLSGNYTASDGSTGNIYGPDGSSAKPDTATLTVPTQYTGTGVGSAIPVSALGQWTTFTTTFPGTTVAPSTVSAQSVAPSVVSGTTVEPGKTQAATTIPGTTVAAKTSTISSQVAKATDDSSAATVSWERVRVFGLMSMAHLAVMAVLAVV